MYGLKVGRQGRIVIPAALCKALGLEPGDTLVCRSEGDRLILRARCTAEEELWKRFAKVKGSLSQELIAERRREAKHEAEELIRAVVNDRGR
jgi:AbrB family looped-hinge helix DNA binding protein